MPGFVAAVALQSRIGERLDVALLGMLKQDMSITEIAEVWSVTRPTVSRLIDYLGYRDQMAKVPRRVKNNSAWAHKQ